MFSPADTYPAPLVVRAGALAQVVLAVGAVYTDAVAAGDEAHYVVARHRRAALGELDEAIVQAFYEDAVDGLLRAGRAFFGLLCYLVEHGLLLRLADTGQLVLDAVDAPHSGLAAIANSGEELVQAGHGEFFEYLRQHVLVVDVGHREAVAAQLGVEHVPASLYILLTPLFLEPLLDLGARAGTLGELEPVTAGSGGALARAHLDDIAVLQYVVKSDYAPVDARPDHGVADAGVYGVGKVYRRRAGRQVYDVAGGREDKDLVGKHVDLQVVDELGGVRLLLRF